MAEIGRASPATMASMTPKLAKAFRSLADPATACERDCDYRINGSKPQYEAHRKAAKDQHVHAPGCRRSGAHER